MMQPPKKSLGQHWLNDQASLLAMCDAAQVKAGDLVLEIGPGRGALTAKLLERGAKVIAVEIDKILAANLQNNVLPHLSAAIKAGPWKDQLEVIQDDILEFDLSKLPKVYKVVANIPYYLTTMLVRNLSETANPPSIIALLVQKEVAQRIAAGPGQMSILGVSAQLYHACQLGQIVPAELFDPAPKVDSQIVILTRHKKSMFNNLDTKVFFKLVKAGFSQRRKKLRSSLSGGLRMDKQEIDDLLQKANINGQQRAQELSLAQWHQIYQVYKKSP